MAVSAKVNGIRELILKLNAMGEAATLDRISFRATFGAAKELKNAVIVNAPLDTGELRRGIAQKRIRIGTKRGYTVGVRSGRTRKKNSPDDPFYWWFLEFGTRFVAPVGFFRRAFAQQREKAAQEIIKAGLKAVMDSGNRALKKIGNGKT